MHAWRAVLGGEAGRRRLLRHLAVIAVIVGLLLAAGDAAHARPADQDPAPPTTDQGPRFGTWGPGQNPPAPEGPADGDVQPPRAPGRPGPRSEAAPGAAPSAPGPYVAPGPNAFPPAPAPAPPSGWDGCNYDLRGNWQITGTQTNPNSYPYSSRIRVRQYRNWLQIDQPQDNVSYYGVCRGDRIELDVYQNGQFVGYQDGTIGWRAGWPTGPWGGPPWSGPTWSGPTWDDPEWSGPRPRFSGGWDDGRPRFVSGSWVMFSPSYATGQETWVRR